MTAFEQDCDFAAGEIEQLGGTWDDADALEPAFESFYREHYAFVWRSARRMLAGAGEDEVEDLIQDTWIAAYRRFDSYEGRCLPTSWLFGIVRNVARNHARAQQRRARKTTAFAVHERDRAEVHEHGDAARLVASRELQDFLATLDDDKRAVFVLAELEGQTGREIAAALGINPNTAQSRLRVARKQFCAYFDLPRSREQIADRTRPLRERPEQPPAEARARSWGLLVAGLAPSTAAKAGVGSSSLALLGKGVLGKLVAIVGVFVAVGVGVHRARDQAPEPELEAASEPKSRAAARKAASSPTIEVAVVDAPLESADEAPIVVAAPAPSRASKPEPDVYELVRQARGAIVSEQPEQALALLARIPASNATLRGPRAATEVAALCRLERGDEARAAAERFAAVEPNSPLLARITSACW